MTKKVSPSSLLPKSVMSTMCSLSDPVDRARLVDEPLHHLGVPGMLAVDDLEGDLLADERMLGEVDDPDAAGPELLQHAVAAQGLADLDPHARRKRQFRVVGAGGQGALCSGPMRFVVGMAAWATLAWLVGACSSEAAAPDGPVPDAPVADAPAPRADANLNLLSQAGLYASFATKTIDPRLRSYEPRFALWADGLGKRRCLDLPAVRKIDTSNMDHWSFPVGTRFWKEFAKPDGTPLETRLISKTGPSTWEMGAYVWRNDGLDADYSTDGAPNVRGTDHDVPSGDECIRCHVGEPGRYLGFSAIQLGDEAVQALAAEDLLTNPPASGQSFALPWDDATNAALGMFHGNCGHCHSDVGSAAVATSMRLKLSIADLALEDRTQSTPWKSIVNVDTDSFMPTSGFMRISPKDAAHSAIFLRMSSRDGGVQMPPIATKHVDTDGVAAVQTWIDSL